MKRRFRSVTLNTDGSMSTSISVWHEAKGHYSHRNALYLELGYRVYIALMKENRNVS